MFKIKVDGVTICNSKIDESMVINPIVTLEANKAGTFTFTIPPQHEYYGHILDGKSIISAYRDDELVFQGICKGETKDWLNNSAITCEGELTYLNDSILRQKKYKNQTVYSLLKAYISSHNSQVDDYKKFSIGMVDVDTTDSILRFTNMQSTMQEINEDLIDNYGGYIRVRYANGKKYIDYLADAPRFNNQVIELGKNLLDYTSNIDDSEMATVIIPQGVRLETPVVEGLDAYLDIKSVNDGIDYVEANSNVLARYGRITKVVEWDDVTVPSILKDKAQKYLKDTQFGNVTITCSAVDMGAFSDKVNTFRLLDRVRIKSSIHGMDKDFILTKMVLNLAEPDKDVFTFGKTEKLSLTAKANKVNTELFDKMPQTSSILEQAKQQASAIIAGAEGGYILIDTDENDQPWRILVMDNEDKEQAVNVIQINRNGIGFSNTGINGEYNNAWTIDGRLVADFITSGTLSGIEVRADKGRFGEWLIATDGADAGSLYTDNGDYRVWLHQAGFDATDRALWVFSIQKKRDDGRYDAVWYADTNGQTYQSSNLYVWNGTKYTFTVNASSGNVVAEGNINSKQRVFGETGVTAGGTGYNKNYALWIVGNGYASGGSFVDGSDRNLKHDIENIDVHQSIEFINNLKPVQFRYNEGTSNRLHHGFIAQEVKEAMGADDWGVYVDMDATTQEGDYAGKGTKGVRYSEIIADLVNTVNYLCGKIKEIEEKE